uniref:molybdopterin molybdotransferase n=1 Tax=Geoglobus ahangari TaxID=113653 RepID=A0A7C3UHW5_9EURY
MVRGIGFKTRTNVDEAINSLISKIKPLETEAVNIYQCYGRVLAEDIKSPIDVPPFDRAAMDGFAVRAEDTFGASLMNPMLLRVIGAVEIGEKPSITVGEGEAVKIVTGAPLPNGADAVLMLEHVNLKGEFVEVLKSVTPFKNVSRKGEDIKKGEIILKKGEIIQPQDVGVIASLGYDEVKVFKRPKVAVISTGNELIEVGAPLEYGRIYNSNNPMIFAALIENGFEPISLGIAKDDEEEIEKMLVKALKFDAVIFTGGTSVGERDLVPKVVEKYGEIIFHGVSMKPGMPTGAAVIDGKPILMLPGSPAAALLSFYTFAVPALYGLMSIRLIARKWSRVRGIVQSRIPSEIGIRTNARVLWDDGKVYPIRTSGSGILSSLVRANALLVIPEWKEGYEEGEEVEVTLLRNITEVLA